MTPVEHEDSKMRQNPAQESQISLKLQVLAALSSRELEILFSVLQKIQGVPDTTLGLSLTIFQLSFSLLFRFCSSVLEPDFDLSLC